MISANQRFKQSGTSKSFKEWLADEQKKGELEVHNKQEFVNANGVKVPFSLSKKNRNLLIVVGIGLLAYGYYRYTKNKG